MLPLLFSITLIFTPPLFAQPVDPKSNKHAGRLEALIPIIEQQQKKLENKEISKEQHAKFIGETKKEIEQIAEQNQDNVSVQTSAGRALRQTGDKTAALSHFDQAVALSPKDPWPRINRALSYFEMGDYPKAAADAAQALKSNPKDQGAYFVYQLSKGRAAINPDQIADLGKIIKPLATSGIGAANLNASNKYSRENFLKFAERLDRADAALKNKNYAQAFEDATWALIEYPDNPRALMQRILAAMGRGDFAEAAADADRGLKLRPAAWQFRLERALALNEAGRPAQARQDAEAVIGLKPDNAEAWLVKATARQKLGDEPASFLADFKRAAELNSAYQPLYAEALSRMRRGERQGDSSGVPSNGNEPRFGRLWITGLAGAAAFAGLIMLYIAMRSGEKSALGGRFKLEQRIGQGGMGTVWKARDTQLDRWVAVKIINERLKASPEESRRFITEAKTVAALKHPNIVSIYDAFLENGETYLVFELVQGETLKEKIARASPLDPAQCLSLTKPIAQALDYAHGRGIIHRDIKPSNIMLEDGQVKIMDFGIARLTLNKEGLTRTGLAMGTPGYMPPEQADGEISRESDFYALGVVVYEMLTGELPFAQMGNACFEKIPQPKLRDFFRRALELDRLKRFHSGSEFFNSLERSFS